MKRKTRKQSIGESAAASRPKRTIKSDSASRSRGRGGIQHHSGPFHAFADQTGLNPAFHDILQASHDSTHENQRQ